MYRPFAVGVVLTALSAAALTGAGLAQRPVDPSAPGDVLYGRVLAPGELHGFHAIACPIVIHGAGEWAAGSSLSKTDLVRNGFVAGLHEQLLTGTSRARAASLVSLFSSAAGAGREVDAEAARARASDRDFRAFRVNGIPRALGYVVARTSGSLVTVSFSVGRLQYVVRIADAGTGRVDRLRDRALSAAHAQYRRIRRAS